MAALRYGFSCMGCSAGLMLAMVVIGMSNVAWTAVLTALVLAYKVIPIASMRRSVALAAVVAVLGVIYALT